MIDCAPYHNSLVRFFCHIILRFVLFIYVGHTSKFLEQTNDLRFLSIEKQKWAFCITCTSHTVSYAFARINNLFPHHLLSCVIYFFIHKHNQSSLFDYSESSLCGFIQLRRGQCHIFQRNLFFLARLM